MINLLTVKYLWDIVENLWIEAYFANTKDKFECIKDSIEDFRKMISVSGIYNNYSALFDELDKIIEALNFKHLNQKINWENYDTFKSDFGALEDHDSDLLPK